MKLTFEEALEDIGDGRFVKWQDVQARALKRKVWIAEWHLPGCLSESYDVCLSKADAIESALMMADSPRGMKTSLVKYGRFDCRTEMYGYVINTVSSRRLVDIL